MKRKITKLSTLLLAVVLLCTTLMAVPAKGAVTNPQVLMKVTPSATTVSKGQEVSFLVSFDSFNFPSNVPAGAGVGGAAVCLHWDIDVFEFVDLKGDSSMPIQHALGWTEPTSAGAINIFQWGRGYITWQNANNPQIQVYPGQKFGTLTLRVKADTTVTSAFVELWDSDFSGTNFYAGGYPNMIDVTGAAINGGAGITIR